MADPSFSSNSSAHSNSTDDKSNSTPSQFDQTPSGNDVHKLQLAEDEHRAVVRSKVVVILTLLGAATVLGLVTHSMIAREETANFKSQFNNYATELIAITREEAATTFRIANSLSVGVTSLSLYENDTTWPNFSLPHVAERLVKPHELSKAILIALSPVVEADERSAWEDYASSTQEWTNEGHVTQNEESRLSEIPHSIHGGPSGGPIPQDSTGPFSPLWQISPVPSDKSIVNFNLFENVFVKNLSHHVDTAKKSALSRVINMTELFGTSFGHLGETPESLLLQPIFEDFSEDAKIVAHFALVLEWDLYFKNILHEGADGIIIVVKDTCHEEFTFEINGPEVVFLGDGDFHDKQYDHMVRTTRFAEFKDDMEEEAAIEEDFACKFFLHVYPSDKMHGVYTTNAAALSTMAVVLIFFFTAMVFVVYDRSVQLRQNKVMNTANRTNEIVASLFPENVRHQIFAGEDANDSKNKLKAFSGKQGLKSFLEEEGHGEENVIAYDSKPIADLFPNTTIMFADISGFTSWSSVREPCQVFTLLETVYHAFDQIARRRGVFKVETVGDCYVAVSGLPEPNKDHAVVMAKFARDCLAEMQVLVRKLEVTLGPDTADLTIRVGLHSGPVTAGVLRGERARFQLFGDTMNTAARIETSGMRDKIHLSEETAILLIEAGKEDWVKPREDVIVAKGKGALQTYWLSPKHESRSNKQASTIDGVEGTTSSDPDMVETEAQALSASRTVACKKMQRLIDWNCELLLQLLKKIVARRNATKRKPTSPLLSDRLKKKNLTSSDRMEKLEMEVGVGGTALDEVCEIITLPNFDAKAANEEVDPKTIELGVKLEAQLRDFVSIIASMYKENPFHCFEHASHVTMSVSKLLSRIAAPDSVESQGEMDMASALHDHTYGITSDPLTQFSVVMAALIHDVDHRGIPNFVLCKEEPNLAAAYKDKSVAEQNSVDLAWNALMDPSFSILRRCIYGDETEMKRFRQLLVNSVMATDIFDKELGLLRKKRWDKAFQEGPEGGSREEETNRKATIVIEHLIQASDVAHTMQHWHVYQKWNARLFQEMYSAFLSGRCDTDPSAGWYQGEIGFFDHYIIPLAIKLKECGVFGVSSDEYLSYATNNRREWETKGNAIVVAMVEKCHAKHFDAEERQAGVPIQNLAEKIVGATQA